MTSGEVPPTFRFEHTIEYQTPDSLDQLHGPTQGTVTVGPHIDTRPQPTFDLADLKQRWGLYSAVVRDGGPVDQTHLLNQELLIELWPELNLPTRCRHVWEARFPRLGR